MKKQITFIVFVLALIAIFSFSVFANEPVSVEADELNDITSALTNAADGDTLNIALAADIEFNQVITINKAITVNLTFNGYQLNYTGTAGADTTTAGIYLNKSAAVLNLKGNNPLIDYKSYTHYGDAVKADMVGTGNLISVAYGELNIENAYLYATNSFTIFGAFSFNADYVISVNASVLRVNEGASNSAISFKGGNANINNVKNRSLRLTDCVEYGGFYGVNYSFNLTRGSELKNVKFYDFYIDNDCWYSTNDAAVRQLMMITVEEALPITNCIFNTYSGELGNVKVKTETGKQNIRLYNCQFNEFEAGSKFSGDNGGSACVFIVTIQPTCATSGLMNYHTTPKGGSYSYYENVELPAQEHVLGTESIFYENGYADQGVGKAQCALCSEFIHTENLFEPVFENLGYSVNAAKDSMTLGIKLNNDALDAYLASTGNTVFDFGLVIGKESINVSVENGAVSVTDGFAVSLKRRGVCFYDVKAIGFNDTNKGIGFVAEFYVYDGESISYVKDDPKELVSVTFNYIVDALDEVKRSVNELLQSKHKLYYNDDGSFRVLILADLHVRANSNTTQIEERIKALVDKEQPNLVVFTGDNTIGAGSEKSLRACLDKMVGYIEENEIPWCHVFGNHDREGALTNEQQQAIYESYEYCISKDVEGISGVGNYVHGIYNKNGTLGSVIYFLDSGTSNSTYTYDYIQDDQIAWYKETSELLQEYNGGNLVKGMMAFHIPLIENQYAYNNRENVEIVYEAEGDRYEAICPSSYDTNLFETILLRGDVKAIVTGHDHNNDYMYNYYGVKLCSAPTISKLGYSNSEEHEGARIFDLNLSTIENIETYVSYIVERINPDDFDTLESNSTLDDFESSSSSFEGTGYDSSNLNGTFTAVIASGKGANGSSALELVRSASGNSEMNIYLDISQYGKLGDNKYLIVWVDFTNVDFRKACFGLLSNNGTLPYRTDDCDKDSPFYYLADGSEKWVSMSHGGDGCFGTAQKGSVKGTKGYLALPIEYFRYGSNAMSADTLVTGIYLYCDVNNGAGSAFYLDNIMLVEDYTLIK